MTIPYEASEDYRPDNPDGAQSPEVGPTLATRPPTSGHCHSDRDGDCTWTGCPQKVDYQSYCPLAMCWCDSRMQPRRPHPWEAHADVGSCPSERVPDPHTPGALPVHPDTGAPGPHVASAGGRADASNAGAVAGTHTAPALVIEVRP